MNDLFLISDLHLGDRGPRDNFNVGDRATRLLRFLDYVDSENGRVVILGDLLELLQTALCRVLPANSMVLRRLCNTKHATNWIVGNHEIMLGPDPDTGCKVCLPHTPYRRGPSTTTIGDRKISFCHGSEFDAACNNVNPGLDSITAVATALLEEKNHGPIKDGVAIEDSVLDPLEKLSALFRTVTFQPTRASEFLAGAEKYRLERGSDLVICGHTHVAGTAPHLVNTGCWCRDLDTFARINGRDGSVRLFEWDGDTPTLYEKDL
jgi:UDP-2,3-diacylglucosamine pyrophosphatase LpxH